MYRHNKLSGFTLVETAIVLVIIGLLIAGIMVGGQLLGSARARTLITELDSLKGAYFGFVDRYHGFPGDYLRATVDIPNTGVNGNGNGRIEPTASGGVIDEHIAVWEHLSGAGFISGRYRYSVGAEDRIRSISAHPGRAAVRRLRSRSEQPEHRQPDPRQRARGSGPQDRRRHGDRRGVSLLVHRHHRHAARGVTVRARLGARTGRLAHRQRRRDELRRHLAVAIEELQSTPAATASRPWRGRSRARAAPPRRPPPGPYPPWVRGCGYCAGESP